MRRTPVLEPGLVFSRLTVVGSAPAARGGRRSICKCSCGQEVEVYSRNLLLGNTTSCGCIKTEKFVAMAKETFTTHGQVDSPEYRTWSGMVDRCENPNTPSFERYGARGIVVCSRWRWGTRHRSGFEMFLKDMGPRPKGTSIERIDNDKGYLPTNCKWGTREEQANNQRPKRKGIPDRIKRLVIDRQGSRCPCGEAFSAERPAQFDHRPALIARKVDYKLKVYIPDQLDPEFIEALHSDCHLQRTVGRKPGAAKTAVNKGSDSWLKTKFKRLEQPSKKRRAKIPARARPWPKSPFAKRAPRSR